MSEIKGQLLGIVLVLAVFGAVSTALLAAFKTATDNVSQKVSEETTITTEANLLNSNEVGDLLF